MLSREPSQALFFDIKKYEELRPLQEECLGEAVTAESAQNADNDDNVEMCPLPKL